MFMRSSFQLHKPALAFPGTGSHPCVPPGHAGSSPEPRDPCDPGPCHTSSFRKPLVQEIFEQPTLQYCLPVILRNKEAQRASLLQSLSPVRSWDFYNNEAKASLEKSHDVTPSILLPYELRIKEAQRAFLLIG
jgi:hypothetical protein